jgi:hypothetical protein
MPCRAAAVRLPDVSPVRFSQHELDRGAVGFLPGVSLIGGVYDGLLKIAPTLCGNHRAMIREAVIRYGTVYFNRGVKLLTMRRMEAARGSKAASFGPINTSFLLISNKPYTGRSYRARS